MNVDSGYSFRVKDFELKMCYGKRFKKGTSLSTTVSYNNSSTQRINMIFYELPPMSLKYSTMNISHK